MIKKVLRLALVISIFFSFFLFLKATDIGESIRLVKQFGFHAVYLFFCTFFAYISGTLGWRFCIDSAIKPSFVRLFMYRHTGNIITLFNPAGAITGEMFNAGMLIRDGVEEQSAYKSVLLARIIMILSQLTILTVVLLWFLLFLSNKLPETLQSILFACFGLLITVIATVLFLILKNGETALHIPENRWSKFVYRIKAIRNSLSAYVQQKPNMVVFAFIAFTVHWVLASLELYFILNFLGYDVKIRDGLFMDTMIIVLKSAFWFIPGQLGIEELINKFTLLLIGISSLNLWLSVSIVRRVRLLFWSAVAGIFYWGLRKK